MTTSVREDRAEFEAIRDQLVSDTAMRARLAALGAPGGLIDQRIWSAFRNACELSYFYASFKKLNQFGPPDRVPVDFTTFAAERDEVHPESHTYSNQKNTGPLWDHIRHKPSDDGKDGKRSKHSKRAKPPKRRDIQLKDLVERQGCVFEADKGAPTVLLITETQDDPFQVCLCATKSCCL